MSFSDRIADQLPKWLAKASPGLAWVERHADVLEVLREDEAFSVCGYGDRMAETAGSFFLGRDAQDPEYCHEWDLAYQALYWERKMPEEEAEQAAWRNRRQAIRDRIRKQATRWISNEEKENVTYGEATGSFDAVALGQELPVLCSTELLGVRDYDDKGQLVKDADRKRGLLLSDCEDVSLYVFGGLPAVWRLFRKQAVISGKRVRERILEQVRHRRGHPKNPKDVMQRILDRGADDELTAGLIVGLTSGATVTTTWLFSNLMDRLMDLPEKVRSRIRTAALRTRATDPAEADDELTTFVREAARFGPVPPMLYRTTKCSHVLAKGSEREERIKPNKTVVFAPKAAGFDEYQSDNPREFRIDRPPEEYLFFGHGQHICIGRYMGETMLEEMTAAAFSLGRLMRVRGKEGQLSRSGKLLKLKPASMRLEFPRERDEEDQQPGIASVGAKAGP